MGGQWRDSEGQWEDSGRIASGQCVGFAGPSDEVCRPIDLDGTAEALPCWITLRSRQPACGGETRFRNAPLRQAAAKQQGNRQ